MLFYSLLFITVTIVTSFIIFGIRSKFTENRVLFQILPISFIYALVLPFQSIRNMEFDGISEHSVGAVVLAVTALYAMVAVGLLAVIGLIRGFREKDGTLQAASAMFLVSLGFMSIFHPAYQVIPVFIVGRKAVRKWKGRKKNEVESEEEVLN